MAPHRVLLAAVLLALVAATTTAAPASARALPSKATWSKAVKKAMTGSQAYLTDRVDAADGAPLAINLDIDNTSLQTTYRRGRAVRPVLALATLAHELGVAVFFNTGRTSVKASGVAAQLQKVGYTVDSLCTRELGETLVEGKQRCRASFVAQGYTIVANVGNNPTDFEGGDYERAFTLPNYRGRLG